VSFKFSKRSLDRLKGVHPKLVEVAKMAIKTTDVDFGITCGTRTMAEQKKLKAAGRSWTLNSKHLKQDDGFSHAVDLVAYVDGEVCWEEAVYERLGDHILKAAKHVDVPLRWGGGWHLWDARGRNSCEELYMEYCRLRTQAGRKISTDMPHWEIGREDD
jgi:peptidoglycan L-alanyl-D-glutamate endopeptidase CwlK